VARYLESTCSSFGTIHPEKLVVVRAYSDGLFLVGRRPKIKERWTLRTPPE
jgi:hypothetical protein